MTLRCILHLLLHNKLPQIQQLKTASVHHLSPFLQVRVHQWLGWVVVAWVPPWGCSHQTGLEEPLMMVWSVGCWPEASALRHMSLSCRSMSVLWMWQLALHRVGDLRDPSRQEQPTSYDLDCESHCDFCCILLVTETNLLFIGRGETRPGVNTGPQRLLHPHWPLPQQPSSPQLVCNRCHVPEFGGGNF